MAIYNKLANINGQQFGVFSLKEFEENMEVLKDDNHCAVEICKGDKSLILPIRSESTSFDKPGVYSSDGKTCFITYPDEEDESAYRPTGQNTLIFSDHDSLQSLSDAKKKLDENINRLVENDGGEVYRPPLLETDTAAMRAVKESISAKNIDLDKYKDRFGANYPNDKRKLKDNDITLNMLERICENLDMKVDIIISDKDENVPNPMNKIIKANIIPGNGPCIITDINGNDNYDDIEVEEDYEDTEDL